MMLSEAVGLSPGPDHDHVPTEIASRFDTPAKADAYAADIVEWCRWAALPAGKRGEAAREWWLRGHVNQAETALDRFMASLKVGRTAGVADWLKGQGTIREAVRAKWVELTRQERREYIPEVGRGDWASLNFDERKNLVCNAMLRRWSGIPSKEQTSSITAVVRGAWTAQGTEERAAMEAQWLDGLAAYAGNRLWLAWRWHSESGAPVRPSLVVATAAVLVLVARKWDEKGRPVPASAIREVLGLPTYNDLPAFLAAARLDGEAARRGAMMTDVELAGLVGVTSMTIGNWRPDFGRFAKSAPDHFFPLGLEGLPDAPAMSLEEIRAECAAVEEALNAARQDRAKSGERRKRQPRALKVEPRAALFRIAVQLASHDLPVPPTFLRALATALGMTSASTGRPLIAPDLLKGLGVPGNIKSMSLFREAARRDGKALSDHVISMELSAKSAFAQALEGKAKALENEAAALEKEGKASEKAAAIKEAAERIRDHLTATKALGDHLAALKLDDGSNFALAWENAAIDPKERDGKTKALRKEATKALREWFFERVHHVLQNGYLTDGGAALQPLTLARDIGMDDNGRNTIRDDWRPLPEYRRLVHTAATAAIMTEAIWRGQNRKAV